MLAYVRLAILIIATGLPFSAIPQPTPPQVQDVEAKGSGTTEEEAFQQALVDAVRQAVGSLVTSENVVKNDKLIEDEILTFSNGLVEKVMKREARKIDAAWEVKLNCTVRKGQLSDTLYLAKIPIVQTVAIDGLSIAARVASELERKRRANLLIVDSLDRFLVDYLSCYEIKSAEPIVKETDNNKTLLAFPWAITKNELNWKRATNNLISTLTAAELLGSDTLGEALTAIRNDLRLKRPRCFDVTLLNVLQFADNSKKMFALGRGRRILSDGLSVFVLCASGKSGVEFPDVIDESTHPMLNSVSIANALLPKMKSASTYLVYRFEYDSFDQGNLNLEPIFSGNSAYYLKRIAAGRYAQGELDDYGLAACAILKGSLALPQDHTKSASYFWIAPK